MVTDFHYNRSECNRSIIIKTGHGTFLGPGIIMADLYMQVQLLLKIQVRMGASSFARFFSVAGVTPSGPAALLVF